MSSDISGVSLTQISAPAAVFQVVNESNEIQHVIDHDQRLQVIARQLTLAHKSLSLIIR